MLKCHTLYIVHVKCACMTLRAILPLGRQVKEMRWCRRMSPRVPARPLPLLVLKPMSCSRSPGERNWTKSSSKTKVRTFSHTVYTMYMYMYECIITTQLTLFLFCVQIMFDCRSVTEEEEGFDWLSDLHKWTETKDGPGMSAALYSIHNVWLCVHVHVHVHCVFFCLSIGEFCWGAIAYLYACITYMYMYVHILYIHMYIFSSIHCTLYQHAMIFK